jgi:predicted MPP superfamily phosphohydrolase
LGVLDKALKWKHFNFSNMTDSISHVETAPIVPGAPSASSPARPHFTVRRIAPFAVIISAILLSANAFACATWVHFLSIPRGGGWQLISGALTIAFIPATFLRFRFSFLALRILYAVTAVWVGVLNFTFFAALACWMVAGAVSLSGFPLPHLLIATILFGTALVAAAYGLINARMIRVSRVVVRLPNLPETWQGRTAALVTDLHLGTLFGAGFLRRVIARLRHLQPDAVFISGDMFDGSPLGVDQLTAPWREFSTPLGIYYVTGNHDEFVDRSIFINAIGRTGVRVLNNEKISLDSLQIVGIHDSEADNPTALRSILRQVQIDRLRPCILLAHQPVNLSVAEEEGVSLQLSGHTHGGQIWPWNLLVSRIYGRFAKGLSRLGNLQLYTSNGVGTWGPPLRVGTKSEIVLIQFENETGGN